MLFASLAFLEPARLTTLRLESAVRAEVKDLDNDQRTPLLIL
jgi:hypothetical protein